MLARTRLWLASGLLIWFAPLHVFAQAPALPAQPVPVQPGPAPAGPLPLQPAPAPGGPVPVIPAQPPPSPGPIPPITVPSTTVPPNNSAVIPATPIFGEPSPTLTPYVTPPQCKEAGFYGSLELILLYPQLHGTLGGNVSVLGAVDSFSVTNPRLDSTGSPLVEFGYRFGDGLGAVAFSYRSTVSTGGFTAPTWDVLGAGFVSSRLNMNVVDLDYVSPAYNFARNWDFAWRAGLRGAAVYYDDEVVGGFVDVHASNNFLGGGPHATVELARILEVVPGLAITSKLDGGVLFGQVSESFDEQLTFADGSQAGGASRLSNGQSVPMVTYQFGITYTPPGWVNWARFGFGYQFEYWWDVGTAGSSHGDYFSNGLYFRGEINF